MQKEQLADYVWIAKGRKYWHVWLGNPFVCNQYRVPIHLTNEERIKKQAMKAGRQVKREFIKRYPEVPWAE